MPLTLELPGRARRSAACSAARWPTGRHRLRRPARSRVHRPVVLAFGALPFDRPAPPCAGRPRAHLRPRARRHRVGHRGRPDRTARRTRRPATLLAAGAWPDRAPGAAVPVADRRPAHPAPAPPTTEFDAGGRGRRRHRPRARWPRWCWPGSRRAPARAPTCPPLLRPLGRLEPTAPCSPCPTPDGQFVGASPELLVERVGDRVRSRPLAGTTDRVTRPRAAAPALLESAKDGEEHRLVVDAIRDALAPCAHGPRRPRAPRPGPPPQHHPPRHDRRPAPCAPGRTGASPTALHLVAAPAPHPGGGRRAPRGRLELIARLEPGARGHLRRSGGLRRRRGGRTVDGRHPGHDRRRVRGPLTAGVGIVAGSRPDHRAGRDPAQVRRRARRPRPGRPVRHRRPTGTRTAVPRRAGRPSATRATMRAAIAARHGPRSGRPAGARPARRRARRRPGSGPPRAHHHVPPPDHHGGRHRGCRPSAAWTSGSSSIRARCSATNVRRWRPRAPARRQDPLVGQGRTGTGRGSGTRGAVSRRTRGSTSPRATRPATVSASPTRAAPAGGR